MEMAKLPQKTAFGLIKVIYRNGPVESPSTVDINSSILRYSSRGLRVRPSILLPSQVSLASILQPTRKAGGGRKIPALPDPGPIIARMNIGVRSATIIPISYEIPITFGLKRLSEDIPCLLT